MQVFFTCVSTIEFVPKLEKKWSLKRNGWNVDKKIISLLAPMLGGGGGMFKILGGGGTPLVQ